MVKKRCSKCKIEKSLELFYRKKSTKNGRQAYCKECDKKYYQTEKGKEISKKNHKKYYQTEKGKRARSKNDERYRQSNKGKEWRYRQFIEHTQYAIRGNLRNLVYIALREYSETGKIMSSKKYGIDYEAIIKHLGLHPNTLGIKGKFHIDHIIPLSSFDLNDPEQIKIAFAPGNHQWLTVRENLKKGRHIMI